MVITFIDHYDSFSFNVLDWLMRSSNFTVKIQHIFCDDEISLKKLKNHLNPLIISPGPGRPENYPLTLDVLNKSIGQVPVLGICLGHQMICKLSGASIVPAKDPWHGTLSTITLTRDHWSLKEIPTNFKATVYHSLVGKFEKDPPQGWTTLAIDQHQELMGIGHESLPVVGFQFHPESISSASLEPIAKNFLDSILK